MAFTKKLVDPVEELPRGEWFIAVQRALKPYVAKEAMAKLAATELTHGHEAWKKELRQIIEHQLEEAVGEAMPPIDIAGMEKNLRASADILGKLLTKNGKAADVNQATARAKSMGVALFTQSLLDIAKSVEVGSVEVFAKEIKGELAKLVTAQHRVAEGGHPAFDQEVAASARRLWIALDTGYDALGICLRKAGIAFDATYAARPTVKSTLRPVLATVPPGAAPAKRKPAAKKPAKAPVATPAEPDPVVAKPKATNGAVPNNTPPA